MWLVRCVREHHHSSPSETVTFLSVFFHSIFIQVETLAVISTTCFWSNGAIFFSPLSAPVTSSCSWCLLPHLQVALDKSECQINKCKCKFRVFGQTVGQIYVAQTFMTCRCLGYYLFFFVISSKTNWFKNQKKKRKKKKILLQPANKAGKEIGAFTCLVG